VYSAALAFTPQGVPGGSRERAVFQSVLERASVVTSLGDLPLAVLTAEHLEPSSRRTEEENRTLSEIHHRIQVELADLSTSGTHFQVEDADHYLQLDYPDRVADAIVGIAAAVGDRAGQELPDAR